MPRSRTPEEIVLERAIGGRIRAARRSRGLTLDDLAGRIGVTLQQLQKYERGEDRISVIRLVRVAHALDVPVEHFTDHIVPVTVPVRGDAVAEAMAAAAHS